MPEKRHMEWERGHSPPGQHMHSADRRLGQEGGGSWVGALTKLLQLACHPCPGRHNNLAAHLICGLARRGAAACAYSVPNRRATRGARGPPAGLLVRGGCEGGGWRPGGRLRIDIEPEPQRLEEMHHTRAA